MLVSRERFYEVLKIYEGRAEVLVDLYAAKLKVGYMVFRAGEVVEAELLRGGRVFNGDEAVRVFLAGDYLLSLDLEVVSRKKVKEEELLKMSREEILKQLGIKEPSDEVIEEAIRSAFGE